MGPSLSKLNENKRGNNQHIYFFIYINVHVPTYTHEEVNYVINSNCLYCYMICKCVCFMLPDIHYPLFIFKSFVYCVIGIFLVSCPF